MRRIVVGLFALSAIGFVGLFALVVAVGLFLSAPRQSAVGPPPRDLAGAQAVVIPSESGADLHGWWVPGRSGAGAVVLVHGIGGNRLQMLTRALKLRQQGCGVLLFDLRAHGESVASRITFGHQEALDVAAAIQFARGHAPGERVALIGVSLGGAAALLGPRSPDVDALVLESVFPDIDGALANRLRAGLGPTVGPIATPILAPLFKLLMPPILGVGTRDLRPIDRIGEVRAPILMLAGTLDAGTTLDEAKTLFARAPEPKRFVAVEGAWHIDLEDYDPVRYWSVVMPFLTKHLRR